MLNPAAKRTGDERTAEDNPSSTPGPKSKLTRLDRAPIEYSSRVRTKISSQSRTGQACDRCKCRKIKCDTETGACAHCREVKAECLVTDRTSGITARRGYYQELERTKEKLEAHTQQLESILRVNGIDVHPWQVDEAGDPVAPNVRVDAKGNPVNDKTFGQDHWTRFNDTVWVKNYQQRPRAEPMTTVSSPPQTNVSDFYAMPGPGLFGPATASVLDSRPTDEHPSMLGLSVFDNEPLSSVRGTTLSIMGTTIDICSLDTKEIENHKSNEIRELPNVSFKAFMLSLTNSIPQPEVSLPSRAEGMGYAEWFFLVLNPFAPALHKPTFMAMLARMYDEPDYKPTSTEKSLAHLVFSMIFYHYGLRGDDEPAKQRRLNELSHQHFHWCLHNFLEPALDTSLQGLQVSYLLALHARNFPKPGCSFILATFAFNRAIELNLHKNPKMADGKHTLHTEMHKRLWWCIVGLLVTLDGRLGNPMPIGLQDIACDFPLSIPDEELTPEGIRDESKIGQCQYSIGLASLRLIPLYMELWSNLYSARRDPSKYIPLVKGLEQGLERWKQFLPLELQAPAVALAESTNNPFAVTINRVYPLYAQMFASEFRLSLRHPSVAMTNDPEFLAENMRICEEEADKMLRCAFYAKKFKALDTTWYQLAVYCGAMFTTLSCHWQRRTTAKAAEVEKLRTDMYGWMEVLTEIARLVGARPEDSFILRLRRIVFDTIACIEQEMRNNPAPGAHPPPAQHPPPSDSKREPGNPSISNTQISEPTGVDNDPNYYASAAIAAGSMTGAQPQPIPYGQVAYQDANSATTYHQASTSPYIFTGNTVSDHAPAANPLIAFASRATAHVASHHATPAPPPTPGLGFPPASAWQEWQNLIADSQAQERFSATVLMDLQAQQQHQQPPQGQGQGHGEGTHGGGDEVGAPVSQWPLTLFNMANQLPEEHRRGGH